MVWFAALNSLFFEKELGLSIPAIIFWAVSGTAAENFRDFPGFSLDFRDAAVFGRKSCYALKILVAESITVSLRDRACSFLGNKRYI